MNKRTAAVQITDRNPEWDEEDENTSENNQSELASIEQISQRK